MKLKGRILRASTTFGEWVVVELTKGNRYQIWMSVDFTHGFVMLINTEKNTEIFI